ncbi:uncharacterized protein LOC120101100 isoform X1 [Rattus norvegicus]|uniref:uncharacterized protein LOC120101100 isoform X1 n=1 Tax=Rattus norvegicus TaxID=10116 RepID=UPI001916DBE2|nr:uncharacterized protein LOC120101100 isoform X1 [Rattus norvegicus]
MVLEKQLRVLHPHPQMSVPPWPDRRKDEDQSMGSAYLSTEDQEQSSHRVFSTERTARKESNRKPELERNPRESSASKVGRVHLGSILSGRTSTAGGKFIGNSQNNLRKE